MLYGCCWVAVRLLYLACGQYVCSAAINKPQTRTQNARLRQRIGMLQAELHTHSGVPPTVQRVLDVLAAKENVGEELAAAGALARRLAPRVTTAQQVVRQGLDAGGHGAGGPPDKEVFRRQATRPPLTEHQLDRLGKQLAA